MRISAITLAALAAIVTVSCATLAPIPIPVYGPRADVDGLAGEWRGSYKSDETGRSGTISFILVAGRDTASGEVIMIPGPFSAAEMPLEQRIGEPRRLPTLLTITFVRAGGARIRGTLDLYQDPDCQCAMRTEFNGTFSNKNTLEGTFESQRLLQTSHIVGGTWLATRVPTQVVEKR